MPWRKTIAVVLLALAAGGGSEVPRASGATFRGDGWLVRYNIPDQDTAVTNCSPDEYVLREAWLERIDALQKGDWAAMASYTLGGADSRTGAAGPMLKAVSNALARGAKVGWVVGSGVNTNTAYNGYTLASLGKMSKNPLRLKKAPKDNGIMHDKMGVFSYAGQVPWVLTGSWNFTGGASSLQWNALVEIQDMALANAYSNELSQLLAGKFHGNAGKSHAWDGATFRLPGWTRDGWVRFAPYPDGAYGGNNALTDITNAIANAREDIFFALNNLSRRNIAEALIGACDRGVNVYGTVMWADWATPDDGSYECVHMLLDGTRYATTNRAHILMAYTAGDKSEADGGQQDLVHVKYAVIDPWGESPLLIQGSANWTEAGLVATNRNDDNIEFIPDAAMAQAFVAQYLAMTDGPQPVLTSIRRDADGVWSLDYRYGADRVLEQSPTLGPEAQWTPVALPPDPAGGTIVLEGAPPSMFFRLHGD